MAGLNFAADHNVCAYLDPECCKSSGYRDMINFLIRSKLHYSLTVCLDVYENQIRDFWESAAVSTENGVKMITSLIAGRPFAVTEDSIRRCLQFGDDQNGVIEFSGEHVLHVFRRMGYVGEFESDHIEKAKIGLQWKFLIHVFQHCLSKRKSGWNDIPMALSSAIIGLVNNELFNMSGYIFNAMRSNLEYERSNQFLMYPRFLQCLIMKLFLIYKVLVLC
ncbi:hypothetical protein HanIR_Chr02g0059491 [Helianthus annuus]|nr:hypothetical protein HanIR_Chr02g0059491 [Helianthus annuus]